MFSSSLPKKISLARHRKYDAKSQGMIHCIPKLLTFLGLKAGIADKRYFLKA